MPNLAPTVTDAQFRTTSVFRLQDGHSACEQRDVLASPGLTCLLTCRLHLSICHPTQAGFRPWASPLRSAATPDSCTRTWQEGRAAAPVQSSLAAKKILTGEYSPGCPQFKICVSRPVHHLRLRSARPGGPASPPWNRALQRSCPRNCPCSTSGPARLTAQTAPDLRICG
jgi:hypothetical protein